MVINSDGNYGLRIVGRKTDSLSIHSLFQPLLHESSEHGPEESGTDFHSFHRGAGMYIGHDVVGGSKRATVVRSARDGVRVTKECRLLPPVGR